MTCLEALRKAKLPSIDQLPTLIKEKIYMIEELHETANLFDSLWKAMEQENRGVPDFDAFVENAPSMNQEIVEERLKNMKQIEPLSENQIDKCLISMRHLTFCNPGSIGDRG